MSVKGVLFLDGRVPLLKNERDEWELPGGRLEFGEDPEACVVREIGEELSVNVRVRSILDSWSFEALPGKRVLIVTYFCESDDKASECRISHEHKELGFFDPAELGVVPMPEGYRRSIRTALRFATTDRR